MDQRIKRKILSVHVDRMEMLRKGNSSSVVLDSTIDLTQLLQNVTTKSKPAKIKTSNQISKTIMQPTTLSYTTRTGRVNKRPLSYIFYYLIGSLNLSIINPG